MTMMGRWMFYLLGMLHMNADCHCLVSGGTLTFRCSSSRRPLSGMSLKAAKTEPRKQIDGRKKKRQSQTVSLSGIIDSNEQGCISMIKKIFVSVLSSLPLCFNSNVLIR